MNDIPTSYTGCFQSLILYSSISNTYVKVTVSSVTILMTRKATWTLMCTSRQHTLGFLRKGCALRKKQKQTTTKKKTLQPRNHPKCRKRNINMSKHMETKILPTILKGRLVTQDIHWKIFHASLKSMLQNKK